LAAHRQEYGVVKFVRGGRRFDVILRHILTTMNTCAPQIRGRNPMLLFPSRAL